MSGRKLNVELLSEEQQAKAMAKRVRGQAIGRGCDPAVIAVHERKLAYNREKWKRESAAIRAASQRRRNTGSTTSVSDHTDDEDTTMTATRPHRPANARDRMSVTSEDPDSTMLTAAAILETTSPVPSRIVRDPTKTQEGAAVDLLTATSILKIPTEARLRLRHIGLEKERIALEEKHITLAKERIA
ncbi:hypothetical protein BAUCODRAFT_148687 [Baudoinia panamericana UAMH 10762]|uniref:Uncharacterized protein n=1 Tax=Baudoinia panamericana (strain UAMH 10762) TaxID=717646 RepID=M2N9L8_BAUPA|nr:uncharacterized protein BAUCODRAFT_148687 [Baudoinia panamericana UAMH 10762]EMC95819.1 hypothetical protein BAUCODRAFT_148687 [Baudoinia panamericana UAMH 10762]